MISVLIFCHNREEADQLNYLCGYCIAFMGDEYLSSTVYYDENGFAEMHGNSDIADLIILEVSVISDIEKAKKLRNYFPYAEVMILSNDTISPENYLIPEIRPALLLLKPYKKEKAIEMIQKLLFYYCHKREKEVHGKRLVICIQDKKRCFDYEQIAFFEARNKKVVLHCIHGEVAFNSSLKELEQKVPQFFMRCHRSFIVNTMYISGIDSPQCHLYLKETIVIPISKKYRHQLRWTLQKLENKKTGGKSSTVGKERTKTF